MARLNDVYRRAMHADGFTTYAVGYLPLGADHPAGTRPAPFLLLDWPRAWLEIYAREGLAHDDILLAEAACTSDPFTWTEARSRHPGASARAFALAAEFGWRDGFVIPIHNERAPPGERFGVISLAAPDLEDWTISRRAAVVSLSLLAFARARTLSGLDATNAPPGLSDREREALSLVAEGMGDGDIAATMRITAATAHFHVEKAKKKLGATTRAQAIAIALTQAYI